MVVRGTEGADEATAEAMAWGWENADRLGELQNPIGYLYRVGLTRSAPRMKPRWLPDPTEMRIPEIEPKLIPALLELSEQQRAAVWLVHGCRWSYAEVSEALDIGRSTVGTHVSRALEALRVKLEVAQDA